MDCGIIDSAASGRQPCAWCSRYLQVRLGSVDERDATTCRTSEFIAVYLKTVEAACYAPVARCHSQSGSNYATSRSYPATVRVPFVGLLGLPLANAGVRVQVWPLTKARMLSPGNAFPRERTERCCALACRSGCAGVGAGPCMSMR